MNTPKMKSNLKEMLDSRRIPIRVFAKQIDYRFESVRQLYHGTTKRIPVDLIERACRELNCGISDLLTLVDEDDADSKPKTDS